MIPVLLALKAKSVQPVLPARPELMVRTVKMAHLVPLALMVLKVQQVLKVHKVLAAICEPVLRPVRKIIPAVQVGGVGIDLSVLVVFLVIELLINTVF